MAIELEVKILNIDPRIEEEKIIKKGGRRVKDVLQKLYTYDLMSIYERFEEIIHHLQSENSIEVEVNYDKLKNLFWEIDNYDTSQKLDFLDIPNIGCLCDILNCDNWKVLIRNPKLKTYLKKFETNSRKWIRLRQSNENITLAVKYILDNHGGIVQNLMETEISVSSFEKTDEILQQLGFVHKSYQEKKRVIFEIDGHEVDFDFWPGIPPFMEFEGKSVEELKQITTLLEYSMDDVVSCTADEVYKMYGKNMLAERKLIFDTDCKNCECSAYFS